MPHGFSRAKSVQILLETVMGEHFVRSSLLFELADELEATPGLGEAASTARRLALDAPMDMPDAVFVRHVRDLADLVRLTSRK
jgi:hypothetical protein